MKTGNSTKKISVVKIVSPILLIIFLIIGEHFLLLIPYVKHSFSIRKLESMREVTKVVFVQLNEINKAIEDGVIDGDEAKKRAKEYLTNLRYGNNDKDYFWGYDTSGTFLFHGYLDSLLTIDAYDLSDPFGKDIVEEIENQLLTSNSATVEYFWYYHEDESIIIPKITYAVKFEPWGWRIATGQYEDDISDDFRSVALRLTSFILIVSLITAFVTLQIAKNVNRVKHERIIEEFERGDLVEYLVQSLDDIDELQSLIPICSKCRKVKSKSGYWQEVETYVMEHFDAEFSHGLCGDCMEESLEEIKTIPNNLKNENAPG